MMSPIPFSIQMPTKAAAQAPISIRIFCISAGCRKVAAAIKFKVMEVQIHGTSA